MMLAFVGCDGVIYLEKKSAPRSASESRSTRRGDELQLARSCLQSFDTGAVIEVDPENWPAPVSAEDLAVMRRMDELHLAWPFYGSRRMTAVLRREGWPVNRKRINRLIRIMALEAIYQKPNTSRKHPDHKVRPNLL
jgi:hypothetical protein